jgi:hypothetical protein
MPITSYEGPATIRQGDQDFAVACGFAVRAPGREDGSWSGRFTEADGRITPDEADLILPGGETGRIAISHVAGTGGIFMGVGVPPS